jgi:hypothetical protein
MKRARMQVNGRLAMRTGYFGIHRFGVDQQSCLENLCCEEVG